MDTNDFEQFAEMLAKTLSNAGAIHPNNEPQVKQRLSYAMRQYVNHPIAVEARQLRLREAERRCRILSRALVGFVVGQVGFVVYLLLTR